MIIKELGINKAFLIESEAVRDYRGYFSRLYCETEFKSCGLNTTWININNSKCDLRGTLRGLHFQRPPMAEEKLVKCTQGAIYDVIVDLRKASPSYGHWHGEELSASNFLMIYVPRGFAHGYLSLTDGAEVIYLSSNSYSKEHQGNLNWSDPDIQINWPMKPLIMSSEDQNAPFLESIKPILL